MVSPVTLFLTGAGALRAGLTVSSVVVVLGEPALVVGFVDPASEFALALGDHFTVTILTPADRALADAFGAVAPAPGGPFRLAEFRDTAWGPRPAASRSWLGATVRQRRPLGWAEEIVAEINHVDIADSGAGEAGSADAGSAEDPVAHLRARYRRLA
nr:flavin reductase [Propioniciclava soli]